MKSKSKEVTNIVPIGQLLSEYVNLRDNKKKIESRMKTLSEQIKSYAEQFGVKDDKGSYYAECDNYIYGKQCKKSVSFDEEKALTYFKDKGFDECIDTVEVINEEEVENLINNGDISFEDLESITKTKVSYAIDVKEKEEMPEVQQTEVPLVASKKARLVIPKGGKK